MTITLKGRIIAKKNSRSLFVNKLTGKPMSAPSARYKRWEADACDQILEQTKGRYQTMTTPVLIKYQFLCKGDEWIDVDNAMTSINDMLQECRIIANDRLIKKGTFEILEGGKQWETQITIDPIVPYFNHGRL